MNNLENKEEYGKKKSSRKSIVLLLLLFVVSISSIYAYWAGNINNPNDQSDSQEITIGEAKQVDTVIELSKELASEGKKLVPEGKRALSVGGEEQNVDSFVTTYTVYWKESVDGENLDIIDSSDSVQGTLNVSGTPVIEGATQHSGLINVDIDPSSTQITADGDAVTVTVTVTLTEPSTKNVYEEIINKNIKLDLSFSVVQ